MQIEIAWIADDLSAQITSLQVQDNNILNVLNNWREDINWQNEFFNKNVAVWQKLISIDYLLQANDRIEWVQDLVCDPKLARFKRLKKKQ